uniref:Calcium uniporter protein n=1 Tax=Mola mola TaxID=94237 RepID=A0A3Q3W2F9_MOLML
MIMIPERRSLLKMKIIIEDMLPLSLPLRLLREQQERCPNYLYKSTTGFSLHCVADVSMKYKYGRLVLEVPLPSRNEKCLFFLRPMLMSVGDLIADMQREDPGVTASQSRSHISSLFLVHRVSSSSTVCTSSEHAMELQDMKHVVHLLHTAIHLPEHHLLKERQLLERLDNLKQQLSPLEKVADESRASRAVWTGLALLSVQGGALAWLTWWVYSWDVMEPVTYFITYATSIGAFAYYVLTKQDYVYPEAKDRQFLHYFYKTARKKNFNVAKYNELKDELAQVEEDLNRLRNPTQLQLPLEEIQPKP